MGFLLATAFFDTDSFTGRITYSFTAENVLEVLTEPAYLLTVLRSVGVAVGVTVLCVLLAVPLAAYMALVASARSRPVLVALVLTPLWASYLVKVYAWRVLLAPGGPLGGVSPRHGRGPGGGPPPPPWGALQGVAPLPRGPPHWGGGLGGP